MQDELDVLKLQAKLQADRQMELARAGEYDQVAVDVDPISSARIALVTGGQKQQEIANRDAYYTVSEMVAQTSGKTTQLFKPYRLFWDGEDFSDGVHRQSNIAWRGISALGDKEQSKKGQAEFVGACIPKLLVERHEHLDKSVITISLPEADESHIMIHYARFDEMDGALAEVAQQIAIPDTPGVREKITQAYREAGTDIRSLKPHEVLVNPFIQDSARCQTLPEWLVEYGIFNPEDVRQIIERDKQRDLVARRCAPAIGRFARTLAEQGADAFQAQVLVRDEVRRLVLKTVANDPELAREIFGNEVADKCLLRSMASDMGDKMGANAILEEIYDVAPEAVYCGVGSCGIGRPPSGVEAGAVAAGLSGELGYVEENVCGKNSHTSVFEMKPGGKMYCPECKKSK